MVVYADLVVLLNFVVDLLLLIGTEQLAGYRPRIGRCVAAAGIGGAYALVCMIPELSFLGSAFWRIVSLAVISVTAFGMDRSALRRGILFAFLSMALGGVAMGLNSGGFWGIVLSAGLVLLMCAVGFRGRAAKQEYVAVELRHKERCISLTALRDTGNTLADPVTGQQVLVVGADIAWDALGLTPNELLDPITTMASGSWEGLRLIPYRAVGQPGGMLLGMCFDEVWIDGKQAGRIVAFAPQIIGNGEGYQALTGGVL